MPSPFGKEHDTVFMKLALQQAHKAFRANEVPVGALVVNEKGTIVARAHNKVETKKTQMAHAECLALVQASKKKGGWRLDGHWLYVTLQPCGMCMALISLSRCAGVLYGTSSPLFGYHQVDNDSDHSLYRKDTMHIEAGVADREAAELLKQFFKAKREKRGDR